MEKKLYELPIIEVIGINKNDTIRTSLEANGKWDWDVENGDGENW